MRFSILGTRSLFLWQLLSPLFLADTCLVLCLYRLPLGLSLSRSYLALTQLLESAVLVCSSLFVCCLTPFIAPTFVTHLTSREVVFSDLDFQGVLLGVSSAASHRCHQFYVIPWDLMDAARRDVEKELILRLN